MVDPEVFSSSPVVAQRCRNIKDCVNDQITACAVSDGGKVSSWFEIRTDVNRMHGMSGLLCYFSTFHSLLISYYMLYKNVHTFVLSQFLK